MTYSQASFQLSNLPGNDESLMAVQVLTIDFAALEKSLSLLPAHEILGIEEELLPDPNTSSGLDRQAVLKDKQEGWRSAADHAAVNPSARYEVEAALRAEAEAKAGTKDSSQLYSPSPKSKSSNILSSGPDFKVPVSAEEIKKAAKASFPAAAAETDTERAFEQLMLSASPEEHNHTQTTKPGYNQAITQEHESKSSQRSRPANEKEKLASLTKGGQGTVDDLESWLDSL